MTTTLRATLRSSQALRIPVSVPTYQSPYWHRDEPLIAVVRLDRDYAELRRHFPDTWEHLVRVKTLFDGIAALEAPSAVPAPHHLRRIAPLLTEASRELNQFTTAEAATSAQAVVGEARVAAGRLLTYARMGEWRPVTLTPPRPGEPWFYCGPLNTWATHTSRSALGLLLTFSRVDLQQEIDAVDGRIDAIQSVVAETLDGPVRSTLDIRPTMQIVDLLLAGGESAFGHKHFAHFFPLEATGSSVADAEFTVVFANVHGERLRRCSVELLVRYHGRMADVAPQDILRSSIQWFRCHDLAHFWRRITVDGHGQAADGLSKFESMVLAEAYADVLGLISIASISPVAPLGQAFTAELLRYLSRRYNHFADSAAAVLTVGWLIERGTLLESWDDQWLVRVLPELKELAQAIHDVRWEADPTDVAELRAALTAGASFRDSLAGVFRSVPTDLDYTFG